jgi:hypothetical protein
VSAQEDFHSEVKPVPSSVYDLHARINVRTRLTDSLFNSTPARFRQFL